MIPAERLREGNKMQGCCGPIMERGPRYCGMRFGIMLVLAGAIWLAAKAGWFDLELFWPVAFLVTGLAVIVLTLARSRVFQDESFSELNKGGTMKMLAQTNEIDIFPVQTVAPWCFCCGQENPMGLKLRFKKETDTMLSTGLFIPEYWSGWGKIMHGGFHAVLLDEITSWVAFGLLGESSFLTKKIQVEYHSPVNVGHYVHVLGELVENNERTIVVRGEIRDEGDTLISDATSTMIRLRPEHMMRHVKTEISPSS